MKFPRNARIFRGRLDVAPFAAVFFLLAIFLLLASLIHTPGVLLQLPVASELPGTDGATVCVAVATNGNLYYQNQLISDQQLMLSLRRAVSNSPEPLTLIVQADYRVYYGRLVSVAMLAREAGIYSAWLATVPRPIGAPASSRK